MVVLTVMLNWICVLVTDAVDEANGPPPVTVPVLPFNVTENGFPTKVPENPLGVDVVMSIPVSPAVALLVVPTASQRPINAEGGGGALELL